MSENSKVKNLRAREMQSPGACLHHLAFSSRLCLCLGFLISIFVLLFSVYFFN